MRGFLIKSMYFVYVLKSLSTGIHYTGQTDNLERRQQEHNAGSLGKFTKGKGPWQIVYQEQYETREEAVRREKYLKTGKGREYLKNNIPEY